MFDCYPLKISSHGFGYKSKESSIRSIIVDEFRKKILEGIKGNKEIKPQTSVRSKSFAAFEEISDAKLWKPEEAGWTFLINKKNSLGEQIIETMSPLARYRRMDGIDSPLLFNDTPEQFWDDWVKQYEQLRKGDFKMPPKYVLIIGSPDSIPFGFQSKLSKSAFVGRLDFEDINQLKDYTEKVIKIDKSGEPLVTKTVVFFATDFGFDGSGCHDPTHFSRLDVEKELKINVEMLHEDYPGLKDGFETELLLKEAATKQKLFHAIKTRKPALVYATSWGMCAPGENMELQKKITGAICCYGDPKNDTFEELLIKAEDIPSDPFLEGGVFFQHSSFSYGTPASSDLHKFIPKAEEWGMPKQIAPISFVASIPKQMVFHKNGPIAFIGHLDEMVSFTYKEGENSREDERPIRLKPISDTIKEMLLGRPVGYAIGSLNYRLDDIDGDLANLSLALHKENKTKSDEENEPYLLTTLADKFLERHQVKNLMLFGDPAVRI